MAHDMDQLEVIPGEQQLVEVAHVDLFILRTALDSLDHGWHDCPGSFNPAKKS